MSDKEEKNAPVDLSANRAKQRRRLATLRKYQATLTEQLAGDPSAMNTIWLKDMNVLLGTDRSNYCQMLEYLLDTEPNEAAQEEDQERGDTYLAAVSLFQTQGAELSADQVIRAKKGRSRC